MEEFSLPQWQCSRCWEMYTFEEFHELPCCWVDPKNKEKYGRAPVCFCGAIFHKDRWHLATFVDGYRISTVHLNMGHLDNSDLTSYRYLYFETMINKGDDWLDFQARYATMEDAIQGHYLAVDNLPKILLNPEKYPSSILGVFFNKMSAAEAQLKTISSSLKERLK